MNPILTLFLNFKFICIFSKDCFKNSHWNLFHLQFNRTKIYSNKHKHIFTLCFTSHLNCNCFSHIFNFQVILILLPKFNTRDTTSFNHYTLLFMFIFTLFVFEKNSITSSNLASLSQIHFHSLARVTIFSPVCILNYEDSYGRSSQYLLLVTYRKLTP